MNHSRIEPRSFLLPVGNELQEMQAAPEVHEVSIHLLWHTPVVRLANKITKVLFA